MVRAKDTLYTTPGMQIKISSSELLPGSGSHHRHYAEMGLRSVLRAGTSTGAQPETFGSASAGRHCYTWIDAGQGVCWYRS